MTLLHRKVREVSDCWLKLKKGNSYFLHQNNA